MDGITTLFRCFVMVSSEDERIPSKAALDSESSTNLTSTAIFD